MKRVAWVFQHEINLLILKVWAFKLNENELNVVQTKFQRLIRLKTHPRLSDLFTQLFLRKLNTLSFLFHCSNTVDSRTQVARGIFSQFQQESDTSDIFILFRWIASKGINTCRQCSKRQFHYFCQRCRFIVLCNFNVFLALYLSLIFLQVSNR